MSLDVSEWLRGLGLAQYAATFRANDIDYAVLRRLTAEDLRELGVASVGHRRRLLDAIAALTASALAADASEPAAETATVLAPNSAAERRQLTVMFCGCGCSDTRRQSQWRLWPSGSALSSLVEYPHPRSCRGHCVLNGKPVQSGQG